MIPIVTSTLPQELSNFVTDVFLQLVLFKHLGRCFNLNVAVLLQFGVDPILHLPLSAAAVLQVATAGFLSARYLALDSSEMGMSMLSGVGKT